MRLRLPLHGRSHFPTGSDPIRGLILYNVLNSGEWFSMTTTGDPGPSGYNLHVDYGDTGMLIDSTGGGEFVLQTNAGALRLLTDGAVSGNIDVFAGLGFVTIKGDRITLDTTGNVEVFLDTGKTFTVKNNSGSPVFRVDEDGDIHIQTGKTITADL